MLDGGDGAVGGSLHHFHVMLEAKVKVGGSILNGRRSVRNCATFGMVAGATHCVRYWVAFHYIGVSYIRVKVERGYYSRKKKDFQKF